MKQVISVNVDEFEGDISVKRNINLGGNINAQGNAHIKKNLRVDGYIDCPNFKGPNKGLFNDLDSLKESYPNPIDGWWALVGNTLPAQLYVVIDEKWEYSGSFVGDGLNIDLVSINDHINDLEQIINEIAANILPFAHKYNTSVGYIFEDEKAVGDHGEIIYFTDIKRFCFCVGSLAFTDWHSKDLYMKDELPRGDKLYTMNNRLYHYDGYDVVLLGSNGNSKPIDIVHERGDSEESVMSQKTVTKELDSIENTIKIKERCPVFDGFAPSGIELNEKTANLDNGSILFSAELGSFVCLVGEKYYASWLDTNGTRKVELYNIFDTENNKSNTENNKSNTENNKSNAVTNKLFICNNKLYFFNGEKMIAYEDALPDYYPDDQNKCLMVDGNDNLTWSSIIPTFYDVIKEPYSVNIASNSEFKMAKNTMYFLHKAYFKNPNSTYPLFAKKDDYGNYIIPTDEGLVKDYMTKTNDIFKPILNKIFTCAADGQQYIYDGFQLRVLTNNQQINLTYSELKGLINSKSLIPGMKYRFDYLYCNEVYDENNIYLIDVETRNYNIVLTANSKESFGYQIIINGRYKSFANFKKDPVVYRMKKNTLFSYDIKNGYEFPADDTLYDYENGSVDVDMGNKDMLPFIEFKVPNYLYGIDPVIENPDCYFYIPLAYFNEVTDVFCVPIKTNKDPFPQYIAGENTLEKRGYVNFREKNLFPTFIESFRSIYDEIDNNTFKDDTSFHLSVNNKNNNVIVNATNTTVSNCKNSIINVSGNYQDLQNCIVEKDTNGETKIYSISNLSNFYSKKRINNISGATSIVLNHDNYYEVILDGNLFITLEKDNNDYSYTYDFDIITGETVYSIAFEDNIRWVKDLTLEPNKRYCIIIDHNYIAMWTSTDDTIS